jgi:hypothetical protein
VQVRHNPKHNAFNVLVNRNTRVVPAQSPPVTAGEEDAGRL